MKLSILAACVALPLVACAHSRSNEQVAEALSASTPVRVRLDGGQTVTFSATRAQQYILAVTDLMAVAEKERARGLFRWLSQRSGETQAAWAARLGRDSSVARAIRGRQFRTPEYVALGTALHAAWEASHGRTPVVAPNPQVLAWVRQNEVALRAVATVDGKHVPWPDGSLDGKGLADTRVW